MLSRALAARQMGDYDAELGASAALIVGKLRVNIVLDEYLSNGLKRRYCSLPHIFSRSSYFYLNYENYFCICQAT